MQAQEEEQKRAEGAQKRREAAEKDEAALDEAEADKKYFDNRMANLQGQITFYELVLGDDNDGDGTTDEIDTRLTTLYEEYDAAKKEFDELDTHVSNLNFDKFKREAAEQEEDEAAFKRDRGRAGEEKAEFEAELAQIATELASAAGEAKTALETKKAAATTKLNAVKTKIANF